MSLQIKITGQDMIYYKCYNRLLRIDSEERMITMKRIVPLLLAFMLVSLCSCGVPSAISVFTPSPPPVSDAPTAAVSPTENPTADATVEATVKATPTMEIPASTAIAPVGIKLEAVNAYPALAFVRPLYFTVAGDQGGDCFVVEQAGRVRVFKDRADVAGSPVFLDIRSRVNSKGNEQGLLGLAFHPDYVRNGYLYVNYTDKKGTVIARFTRQPDNPLQADPASELILLTFPQPYENHNGGQLAFGSDGYLYIGVGDGGLAGDPNNNAQNRSSLLGKILRIDVDHPAAGRAYGIPAGNPLAGNASGYREEIFALGLRNPWRFSFDQQGKLWVADVGQDKREEIDLVENGGNYGWNVMEGTLDYKKNPKVDKAELLPPIWEYNHNPNECITGGYVYTGDRLPELRGRYIYGDYVSGKIWALWFDANGLAQNQELLDTSLGISSFGMAADGEIRIVDLAGKIYRLRGSGQ
jgi:glucose/arabinose dehydrogenase